MFRLKLKMKEKNSLFAVFGFFGILAFVLLIGLLGTLGVEEVALPDSANAGTSSSVAVTASVIAEISCDSNPGSTLFGTLSSGSIITSDPNATATMACANSGGGCILYVKDASAGLATTSPAHTIPSPNAALDASNTLSIGVEGYGIQATGTAANGSGASFSLGPRYKNVFGNYVGGLTTGNQTLVTANSSSTGREVLISHKAAISATTPGGKYEDTITFECTAQ